MHHRARHGAMELMGLSGSVSDDRIAENLDTPLGRAILWQAERDMSCGLPSPPPRGGSTSLAPRSECGGESSSAGTDPGPSISALSRPTPERLASDEIGQCACVGDAAAPTGALPDPFEWISFSGNDTQDHLFADEVSTPGSLPSPIIEEPMSAEETVVDEKILRGKGERGRERSSRSFRVRVGDSGGREVEWEDILVCDEDGGTDHLDWPDEQRPHPVPKCTVMDIIHRIESGDRKVKRPADPFDLLPSSIPQGQTNELLIPDGVLVKVERLLVQDGRIDLDSIRQDGFEAHIPHFLLQQIRDRLVGDPRNIVKRMAGVLRYIKSDLEAWAEGRKPIEADWDLERYRELAVAVRSRCGSNNKPNLDDLFHLLCLIRFLSRGKSEFTMTEDWAARAMGFIPLDPVLCPRNSQQAKQGRDRVAALLGWIWDEGGRVKGLHLITRTVRGRPGVPSRYRVHWRNWRRRPTPQ